VARQAAYRISHVVGPEVPSGPLFRPTRLKASTTLGRTAQNDVVLASGNVSRRHAKIVVTDEGVVVHDLDSHNGVFVNGTKVRTATMRPGDRLYVADVCIALEDAPGGGTAEPEAFPATETARVQRQRDASSELGHVDEADPSVRSLATLLRATELMATADDDAFAVQVVEMCRELTTSTLAALVSHGPDGKLDAQIVLQPESSPRGDASIAWSIVRRAIEDRTALFSADLKAQPLVPDDPLAVNEGCVMCVPILGDARSDGALFLMRRRPSPSFGERELQAVTAVAHLFSLRRRHAQVAPDPGGNDVAAAHAQELERLTQAKKSLERERETLLADFQTRGEQFAAAADRERRLNEEAKVQADALERSRSVEAALRKALRASTSSTVAEHVERAAAGTARSESPALRIVAAVVVQLTGFDLWVTKGARPDDVQARLDRYCGAIRKRAQELGGRVEQVLGHTHVVVFTADGPGVRAAARFGLSVRAALPADDGVGVAAALHVGPSLGGLFGGPDGASQVEAGEALFVARGLLRLLVEPAFVATDAAVRLAGNADGAFSTILRGPAAIVGLAAPVVVHAIVAARPEPRSAP
jgi:hypothetical protein